MSAEFPFQALLDALNEAGFRVDARQRLDFFALCSRYDGGSRDEFSRATASLFAATPGEYKQILNIFDRIYPREGGGPSSPLPPPRKPFRWKRFFIILGCLLSLIVVLALALRPKPPIENAAVFPAASGGRRGSEAPPIQSTLPPSEALIQAPASCENIQNNRVFWRFPFIITGAALGLGALFASAAAGRKKRRNQREKGLTRALISLDGPRHYRMDYPFVPLVPEQLDAMIALLEEALASIGHLKELDIDRTVEQTVHRGLVPSLHYRTRHGALRALVFIDIGDLSRPYRAKINVFVQRLKQRGLDIDCLYFDRHPARVSKKPGSKLIPLETMASKFGGIPMILIATGEALTEESEASPLSNAKLFQAWPQRILLNPIGDPKHWVRHLDREHAGIAAFPMNKEGLLSARQALLEQRSRLRAPRSKRLSGEPLFSAKNADPDLLKALFSMAPLPSYELAWALRERFFPGAPEEIVLSCRYFIECSVDQIDSKSFQMQKERAFTRLKELDGSGQLQNEGRRFYIELLQLNEPAQKDSAAYLRWRRDLAFLYLQSDQRDEIQKGIFELRQLAEGPLRNEIAQQLQRNMVQTDRMGLFSDVLRSVQGARLNITAGKGFVLAWPGLKSIGLVILLVGLSGGIFNAFGFYSARPLPWGGMVLGTGELEKALCLSLSGVHDVLEFEGNPLVLGSNLDDPRRFRALYVQSFGQFYRFYETSFQFESGEIGPSFVVQWATPDDNYPNNTLNPIQYVSAHLLNYTSQFQGFELQEYHVIDADSLPIFRSPPVEGLVRVYSESSFPQHVSAAALERIRWQHSRGILPGSGEDVWKRLMDSNYPRAPQPVAPTPTPTPKPASPPACEQGKTRCNSECIDLQNDKNNCGECGKACGQGQICAGGLCQRDPKAQAAPCPGGQSLCGSECKNLQSDILNCGQCDRICGADKVCTRGLCQPCPAGTVKCGSGCVNTNTHQYHCGDCFKVCSKGGICKGGICVLPSTPAATSTGGIGKPAAPAKPPAATPDKSPQPRDINLDEPSPGGQVPVPDPPR